MSRVWFTDRNLGYHLLPGALAAAGFDVVPHDRHFAVDTPDEVWIAEVGRRQWVMLSQDYMILRRPAQRDAVMRAGARLILLPGAREPMRAVAGYVSGSKRALESFVEDHPEPFIARLMKPRRPGAAGRVEMRLSYRSWLAR